jgi:hypothetical protein
MLSRCARIRVYETAIRDGNEPQEVKIKFEGPDSTFSATCWRKTRAQGCTLYSTYEGFPLVFDAADDERPEQRARGMDPRLHASMDPGGSLEKSATSLENHRSAKAKT